MDNLNEIQKITESEVINILNDEKAKKEVEDYKQTAKRGESYKYHIHILVLIGIYIVSLLLLILIIIRSLHFILPESCRWLSEHDLNNIERIVFSSIILSLASKYFKQFKIFGNAEK